VPRKALIGERGNRSRKKERNGANYGHIIARKSHRKGERTGHYVLGEMGAPCIRGVGKRSWDVEKKAERKQDKKKKAGRAESSRTGGEKDAAFQEKKKTVSPKKHILARSRDAVARSPLGGRSKKSIRFEKGGAKFHRPAGNKRDLTKKGQPPIDSCKVKKSWEKGGGP